MWKKLPKPLSYKELEQMRKNARIHKKVLDTIREVVKPWMTAWEIDELAGKITRDAGMLCAFRGQYWFPANICISVNDVIAHGIPYKDLVFKEWDLVNFDFWVRDKQLGINTDSWITLVIGWDDKNPLWADMIEVTKKALYAGIAQAKHWNTVGDIWAAVQAVIDASPYHIVRDLSGHGIGRSVHEEPYIYNYGKAGTGLKLKAGMTIAIEPLIWATSGEIYQDSEDVIFVADGSLGCQYEHSILITEGDAEIII